MTFSPCFAPFLILFLLCHGHPLFSQRAVSSQEGYHLMDEDGDLLTDAPYEFIGEEYSDVFVSIKDQGWGFINRQGKPLFPMTYDVAYPFDGSFALVGAVGKYYHITKNNKKLIELSWPKAPMVFNDYFLIQQETSSKVFDPNGAVVFESEDPIFLAKKSGIVTWNSEQKELMQYYGQPGRSNLLKVKRHKSIDTFVITHQGYLCIALTISEGKCYTLYDKQGSELVSILADGVHPNYIRSVWSDFFYNPDGTVEYREVLWGQEVHFPMQFLLRRGQKQRSTLMYSLCDRFEEDKMVKLPQSEKWIQFDGTSIIGHRIYDDVLPGDGDFTPVKLAEKWYLLDRKNDSLIATKFKSIHPIGMDEGRFFASYQALNSIKEIWHFVNIKTDFISEETFAIPLENTSDNHSSLFENTNLYRWNKEINKVQLNDKMSYINNKGRILWTEQESKTVQINDYFKTTFRWPLLESQVIPREIKTPRNELSLVIQAHASGIETQLVNREKSNKSIEVQSGYLRAVLEIQNKAGLWEDLARITPATCGNSYYFTDLPAGQMSKHLIPFPKGNHGITVRVRLKLGHGKYLNSNTISIQTNKARTWIKSYEKDFGALF